MLIKNQQKLPEKIREAFDKNGRYQLIDHSTIIIFIVAESLSVSNW